MKEILEKVFNLIRKTGDKIIIINSDNKSSWVVMNLDDYERLADKGLTNLTEKEPIDKIEKINQDIALWREEESRKINTPIISEDEKNKNEDENQFYFEPVE